MCAGQARKRGERGQTHGYVGDAGTHSRSDDAPFPDEENTCRQQYR